MVVEVDENKLKEMQEDLDNYVKLIKRYDESFAIKDEIIRNAEKELKTAKNIIVFLLEVVKEQYKDDVEMLEKLTAILNEVEETSQEPITD